MLPRLQPGMCAAIVEDWERPAYHAPMQRITAPGEKRCSRKAKQKVGHLDLCTVHARQAREGFVRENGTVEPKLTIRDCRMYNITPPNHWAKGK